MDGGVLPVLCVGDGFDPAVSGRFADRAIGLFALCDWFGVLAAFHRHDGTKILEMAPKMAISDPWRASRAWRCDLVLCAADGAVGRNQRAVKSGADLCNLGGGAGVW